MVVDYYTRHGIQAPSTRYRGFVISEALASESVVYRIIPLVGDRSYSSVVCERNIAKASAASILGLVRVVHTIRASQAELAIVHKDVSPLGIPLLERLIRKKFRRMVLEIDDNVFSISPRATHLLNLARRQWAIRYLASTCDAAICGSSHLTKVLRQAGCTKPIAVIPTVCPAAHENAVSRQLPTDGRLRVMWIGTSGNLRELHGLEDVMVPLAASGKVECLAITDPRSKVPPPWSVIPWQLGRELEMLAAGHVGVMPLEDNEWTRGKCGFKLLQYMSAGLVPMASPVGVNTDIIEHATSGFLCGSSAAWMETLLALCSDSDLRLKVARAARARLLAHYTPEVMVSRYCTFFERVLGGNNFDPATRVAETDGKR